MENLLGLLAFIAISSSYSICKGSKYEGQVNFQENYDTAFILDDDTLVEEIYEHAPAETKAKILMLRPRLIEAYGLNSRLDLNFFDTYHFKSACLDAAKKNRDPFFFESLSWILSKKIRHFSEEKTQNLHTKDELKKHAYSLLFTMSASQLVFGKEVRISAQESFNYGHPIGGSMQNTFEKTAFYNARKIMLHAASRAAWKSGWSSTEWEAGLALERPGNAGVGDCDARYTGKRNNS